MIRKALHMSVGPQHQDGYIRRHGPIWRDLEQALLAHGVRRYSIFLDPQTSDLFAAPRTNARSSGGTGPREPRRPARGDENPA